MLAQFAKLFPRHATARFSAAGFAEDISNARNARKSAAMACISANMILSCSNTIRVEKIVGLGAVVRIADPALDNIVHIAVEFAAVIPEDWMVEHSGDIVEHLMDRNIGMLPRINNARSYVL